MGTIQKVASAVRIGCLRCLRHPEAEFGHPHISKILCAGVRIDTQLFLPHICSNALLQSLCAFHPHHRYNFHLKHK